MKNMKKFVAIATAATLALAPMTAFASTLPEAGSGDISGDVNYVNTTVYSVTLPTTAGMEFALDPQGLTSLDNGGSYSDTNAGKIVCDTAMTAVNKSSVALNLEASFYVTDSTGTLTLVDAEGTVENDKQQIQLQILADTAADPGVTDGTITAAKFTQTVATVTSQSSTAPTKGVIDNMAAATYEYGVSDGKYTYELKDGEEGTTINMIIGGTVAKNYDWSAYTAETTPATIKLSAVFKFVDPAAAPATVENTTIVDSDSTKYSVANGNTYAVTWKTAATDEQKTISNVEFSTDNSTWKSGTAAGYVLSEDKATLTVKETLIGSGGIGNTRYVRLTLGTGEVITLTLDGIIA